ncbi:MAG: DUF3099 domain-containing protein [Actinomycetes bacterium]
MKGKSNKSDHRITSAQLALSEEQISRQRKYFLSMMVRTACFILTIVLPSPYRWVALFGAVILPYVAVVIANAGRENGSANPSVFTEEVKSIEGN